MDATDPHRLGPFWGRVLDLDWRAGDDGEGGLFGRTPGHTIWFNRVPEARTVKHRVHLDVFTVDVDDLTALGSTVVLPPGDDRSWTLMADLEGGEYCAFVRPELPPDRLHGLAVDCADPSALAAWWASVYGGKLVNNEEFVTVENIPGMPIATMDFASVPEPKTVKNRIHWDVSVDNVQALIDAGATVLRPLGGDLEWHMMADPEGNEFCAFVD